MNKRRKQQKERQIVFEKAAEASVVQKRQTRRTPPIASNPQPLIVKLDINQARKRVGKALSKAHRKIETLE